MTFQDIFTQKEFNDLESHLADHVVYISQVVKEDGKPPKTLASGTGLLVKFEKLALIWTCAHLFEDLKSKHSLPKGWEIHLTLADSNVAVPITSVRVADFEEDINDMAVLMLEPKESPDLRKKIFYSIPDVSPINDFAYQVGFLATGYPGELRGTDQYAPDIDLIVRPSLMSLHLKTPAVRKSGIISLDRDFSTIYSFEGQEGTAGPESAAGLSGGPVWAVGEDKTWHLVGIQVSQSGDKSTVNVIPISEFIKFTRAYLEAYSLNSRATSP
jgi:hypothetical protein